MHGWPLSVRLTRRKCHWHAIRNALALQDAAYLSGTLATPQDRVEHLRSSAHLPGGHIFSPFWQTSESTQLTKFLRKF